MHSTEEDDVVGQMGNIDLVEIPAWTKAFMNPLPLGYRLTVDYVIMQLTKAVHFGQYFLPSGFHHLEELRPTVCLVWADISALHLGRLACLNFAHLPKGMSSFNAKLAGNVCLPLMKHSRENTLCRGLQNCVCKLDKDFRNLAMPEISKFLTQLAIEIDVKYLPKKGKFWSNFHFRNRLDIIVEKWGGNDEVLRAPQFRALTNLRKFSSKSYHRNVNDCEVQNGANIILQELLNSAINLEEIDINADFCPNLSPCKKLRILIYESIWKPSISVDGLAIYRMLEACSNSLVQLTLSGHYKPNNLAQIPKYSAPNLTHLILNGNNVNRFLGCPDVAHLPKLAHLKICAVREDLVWKMFQNCSPSHEGITSFDIKCHHSDVEDVQGAAKIVKLFPSVTEFKMTLISSLSNFERLREMLNSFRDWSLAKGLQNTTLHFKVGRMPELSDRLRDALISCGSMRHISMAGITMNEETKGNLRGLIAEKGLPISL
ncbi:hypothetical protein Fcan01_25902 [Folsomia candida]|uniref:Uncharacterized protein n=1 Tax=Folsomia candida TaxID=158441 RepID=A0A226D2F8_FOLCA|nr:hypothetical protein Fcan01_25902 [Folsomia candida]